MTIKLITADYDITTIAKLCVCHGGTLHHIKDTELGNKLYNNEYYSCIFPDNTSKDIKDSFLNSEIQLKITKH